MSYKEMAARELTQAEIDAGTRGINDQNLTATQIQALTRRMDASKKKWRYLKMAGKKADYEEALKKENEELYFNYPSLFQMHAEDRLDSTFFDMLQLKRKIEKGEMSSEEASRVVGQTLFNRFVPHATDAASPAPVARMSYEDYCKDKGYE